MVKKNSTKAKKVEKASAKKEVHFIHSLREVLKSHKGETITFGDIMHSLKEEGLIFLIAIVSFPTAIPIPTPPGFTTLFGIPLCVLTFQMIYNLESPWLPQWLRKKRIKVETFKGFVDKAEPVFEKLSGFLRPRYLHFTTRPSERIIGILALICSISITLPILFGNAVPSMGILIMSVGLLYQDGFVAFIGMVVSVVGIIIASTVVFIMSFFGLQFFYKILDGQIMDKLPF
jgi:hypothetical protein